MTLASMSGASTTAVPLSRDVDHIRIRSPSRSDPSQPWSATLSPQWGISLDAVQGGRELSENENEQLAAGTAPDQPITVSRISVTPVKGLALHHPEQIEVSAHGVVGDRLFFLIDDKRDLISVTEIGELTRHLSEYDPRTRTLQVYDEASLLLGGVIEPGDAVAIDFYGLRTVTGHLIDGGWADLFSTIAGRPVALVMADAGAQDVTPLTLLGTASTAELAARNGVGPVDGRRFRMTLEFDGGTPHIEDDWDGRLLRLGDVVARVGGPVQRCAATTRHPDTGVINLQTLRMIGAYRGRQQSAFGLGFNFGVYADVVTPGSIRVGDVITVGD